MQLTDSCAFNSDLAPFVSNIVKGRLRLDVSASTVTTLAVGGRLSAVVTVESVSELQSLLGLLFQESQPVYTFGFGSNLLVSDSGFDCWIVRLGKNFKSVEVESEGVFKLAGGGALMTIARRISEDGFSGLEFAAGIPASIGGAVFMNAGAHGGNIGERVLSVNCVMPDGSLAEFTQSDLPWSYRMSGLPAGSVVTSVVISLIPGDREAIAKHCEENLAYRRRTQPLALPSAGSVFKNPSVDNPAGRIIEEAGLKGLVVGGAEVSQLHANWIVNPRKIATASDVYNIMHRCIDTVRQDTGVVLAPEVRVLGSF